MKAADVIDVKQISPADIPACQTLGGCLMFAGTSGATMSCDLQLLLMIENDTPCHAELLSSIAVHGRQ